jgi:hypothetical protein
VTDDRPEGGEARDEAEIRQAAGRFLGWLKSGVPVCRFIAELNRKGRIQLVAYAKIPDPDTIHRQFAVARRNQKLALTVLPRIRSDGELARLFDALAVAERFALEERPSASTADAVGVDIYWRHDDASTWSSLMGFAPSWLMPSTRRAPYCAMALWPGGHDNPKRTKPDSFVGVGDMSHQIPQDKYSKLQRITRTELNALRTYPSEPSLETGLNFRVARAEVQDLQFRSR